MNQHDLIWASAGRCGTTFLAGNKGQKVVFIQERSWSKYAFVASKVFSRQLAMIIKVIDLFSKTESHEREIRNVYLDPLLIYINMARISHSSLKKPNAFLFRNPVTWTISMESKIKSLRLAWLISRLSMLHIAPIKKNAETKINEQKLLKMGVSRLSTRLFLGYLEICRAFNDHCSKVIAYEGLFKGDLVYNVDPEVDALIKAAINNNINGKRESNKVRNSVIVNSDFLSFEDKVIEIWNQNFTSTSPFWVK